MIVDIVLLTNNSDALDAYLEFRNGLIPKTIRERAKSQHAGIEFTFRGFLSRQPSKKFTDFLVDKCNGKGLILLVDSSTVRDDYCSDVVCASCFTYFFDIDEKHTKNHFSRELSSAIKDYLKLSEQFAQRDKRALLSLPFKAFKSRVLELLKLTFVDREDIDWNELQKILRNLSKSRRPRRGSASAKKILFSDDQYFFEYANEKHALVETGGEHYNLCVLSGRFRFGCILEADQHFNMYKEKRGGLTVAASSLENCHGEMIELKARTHANVFSNDHVT